MKIILINETLASMRVDLHTKSLGTKNLLQIHECHIKLRFDHRHICKVKNAHQLLKLTLSSSQQVISIRELAN